MHDQFDNAVKEKPISSVTGQKSGKRSEAFDFLLSQDVEMPTSKYSKTRGDNYNQYVNDLNQGDMVI